MNYYKYRLMSDIHIEDEIAEEKPWFEIVLVDPDENVVMPAFEKFRHLTEFEARNKVDQLNAQINNAK